ncbi:MAG: metallophosphoesterase [Gammaproteobacteria bacterium]|nr:metallophosphoesterase [Gammaproteobacteria bacterium]
MSQPKSSLSKQQLLIVLAAIVAGCSGPAPDVPALRQDVASAATPWTHESFDDAAHKFTFAVFSDLTGGERPRVFEIAVAQLNLLRPELVINVGDLIEGASGDHDELHAEWDSFDERTGNAKAPVFYVGGNHDLTGEPLQQVWQQRYGRRYYYFVYKNVLFLVLDTEDNTPERSAEIFRARNESFEIVAEKGWDAFDDTDYGRMPERKFGTISAKQSQYFVNVIAENPGVRWTFIFVHKPAWERDNEMHFAAIENALSNRPYTVFNGHEHVYEYAERHGRDYIQLATTGGVQFPDRGLSADQVTLVTVDDHGVDIANLLLSGILDKTGHIPLDGNDVCFDAGRCGDR